MNEVEKKLIDKWSNIINPCGEIPLDDHPFTLNTVKILENQDNYLKKMFTPPEEPIWEDVDEYEKEMAKNILLNKNCENCEYSSCTKEQKQKYGTCSVWKDKVKFNQKIIFPIIKKTYPTSIKGQITKFPTIKDDSI